MPNKNTKKPVVWFISRAYPPVKAIGSDRATKWIRSFISKNYEVVVFTIKIPEIPSNKGFYDDGSIDVRRVGMFFSNEFNGIERKSRLNYLFKLVYTGMNMLLADSGWTWAIQLRQSLRLELLNNKPDFILATGSPFTSFVSVRNVALRYGIPYVLDYRDLWSQNPHVKGIPIITAYLTRFLEKMVNKDAFFLTTVSQGCSEVLSKDNEAKVIYNIPDNTYIENIFRIKTSILDFDNSKLNLFFGGTLYPNQRDLEPLVRSISLLPLDIQKKIVFHYCGSTSVVAIANFQKFNLLNILIDYGVLSKNKTLSLMKSADICISIVHNSSHADSIATTGLMTTKIYDYIIAKKFVLNIAPINSELAIWLDDNNYQNVKSFIGEDNEGIKKYLKTHIDFKLNPSLNSDEISNDNFPLWENQFNDKIFPSIFKLRK